MCSSSPSATTLSKPIGLLIGSALWWPDGIGYTLFLATPLIFTGLAVAVAFRAGLLNIGAEGQLYVAAFATAWAGIVLGRLPAVVLIPLCMAAAIVAGAHLGRHSRTVEGAIRIARSDQHDHDELHRRRARELLHAISLPRSRRSDPADRADFGERAHSAARRDSIPGFPERIPLNVAFLLALAACGARLCVSLANQVGVRNSRDRQQSARPRSTAASPFGVRSSSRWRSPAGWPAWSASTKCSGIAIATTTASPTTTGLPASLSRCSGRNHPVGVIAGGAAVRRADARRHSRGCLHAARYQGHRPDSAGDDHPVRRGGSVLPRSADPASPDDCGRGSSAMAELFTISLIWSTIRLSTPLILAALGGLFSERSGVINIALEGMMLAGAFTAAAVTYATGSPWIGLPAADRRGPADRADSCGCVHPLQGRSGRRRHGDQHPDDRAARISERRLFPVLGVDAADCRSSS